MTARDEAILRHVRKSLALYREPGWNFPGNFLGVSFDDATESHATTSLDPGPHCVDPHGRINRAALLVLIDVGLAVSLRLKAGMATRMATINLTVQFTGHAATERLVAHGEVDAAVEGTQAPQILLRQKVTAGDAVIATACGSFIYLGNSRSLQSIPRRGRSQIDQATPLDEAELTLPERAIYDRATWALASEGAFLDRFWNMTPLADGDGASCRIDTGAHIGNRVGHLQGGIGLAIVCATAEKALDESWILVGVSGFFVEGGSDPVLTARAEILRRGNLNATIRCRILNAEGRVVIEAVTTHARRSGVVSLV